MKQKLLAFTASIILLVLILTGCIQNDISVKMNKNGTGSISASIGIEKDFYQNLKQMGSDPFKGKTTTEYIYEDKAYVAYTEIKEYRSYEEMEKALLEMTYDTELIENAQQAQDGETNSETITVTPDTEPAVPEKDNHIFSTVDIEKNSGLFYSSYTFNAVMNPQSSDGLDYDMNDTFKVTLTVEMPEKITRFKGGKADGNKITFDIADVTERQELAATAEADHFAPVIAIVIGLLLLVIGLFCFIKIKK